MFNISRDISELFFKTSFWSLLWRWVHIEKVVFTFWFPHWQLSPICWVGGEGQRKTLVRNSSHQETVITWCKIKIQKHNGHLTNVDKGLFHIIGDVGSQKASCNLKRMIIMSFFISPNGNLPKLPFCFTHYQTSNNLY